MFEIFDDMRKYGSYSMTIISFILIAASGIFFSIIYYIMSSIQTAFGAADCVLDSNAIVSSCQELWELAVYPFLELRYILIWFSFFFIFALVLGMLINGYKSGKSPYLLGLLVSFVGLVTYLGIELSNMYRTILVNDVMREMLIEFPVYNKIMINFPAFCFIVGLFAILLGLVNYQKTRLNKNPEEDIY